MLRQRLWECHTLMRSALWWYNKTTDLLNLQAHPINNEKLHRRLVQFHDKDGNVIA